MYRLAYGYGACIREAVQNLEEMVNSLMAEGYQPQQGSTSLTKTGEGLCIACQGMVK